MSIEFYTCTLENTICIPMTSNAEVTSDCALIHTIEDGDKAGGCDTGI